MQSSARNPNQRYLANKTEAKKKSVLPFSKQLLSLQKKIQEVQDKNELILQRIHKAYDFKKSKNKVYYEAPGMGEDERSFQNVQQQRIPGLLNMHADRGYPSLQPQYIQPRQFEANKVRRNTSMVPTPSQVKYFSHVEFQPQYVQPRLSQGLYQSSESPIQLGLDSAPFYHQQHEQIQSNYQVEDNQNQHQLQQSQQNMGSDFSQGEADFKSSSNYSDVQKRKTINDNFRKRQKDFSDIMSSIEDRRGPQQRRQLKKSNNKSYIYNIIENNSLYSQGHIPSKENIEQHNDFQVIERPVTVQHPKLNRPRSPYRRPMHNVSSQERIGVHSTNQLQHQQSLVSPQNRTLSSIPHPPSLPMMVHSLSALTQQAYQSQPSTNEITFLQQMYKVERQKTLSLERQMLKKQQNIEHLKKYKKSFKKFFQNTHYVIEQAFDQFVETFLRNRVYKIEKVVKKNQNRLSALVMQLKDIKQEREYTKSLKSLSTKIAKRSYSSNEQTQKRSVQNQNEQQGLEQNYSWVSSRSVSAKNRRSKDKSVTKKSNQSHIVMKKEFNNIAENYQAMIKVKNEEIEKYQTQLKQAKFTILSLQEDNNRLKIQLQQYLTRPQIPQPPLTGSNVESDNGKKTSGNLRILSRNSSRTQIKKGMNSPVSNPYAEQNQQLLQKIRNLQQQIQRFSNQNSSLEQQLDSIHKQHLQKENQLKQLNKQLSLYQKELIPQSKQRITELQASLQEINKHYQQLNQKNLQLDAESEIMREHLNQRQMRILQLDSKLYLKNSELKKAENLLTLKNHKLQEFNKFLLEPSGNQPLNDSISSAIQDPQNKTTFMMLQNLQKQLEEEKYEKEVEFLKLKKSYQSKIQQLKIELEEIALQNEKLAQRLNTDDDQKRKLQQQKEQLTENNQKLKIQIDKLKQEVSFLTDKLNFFQVERKTASFIHIPKVTQTHHLSENNFDHLKPQILKQQDFDDFPAIEDNLLKVKEKSLESWKPASGQIQLLDQSSATGSFDVKKSPSEQNHVEMKRVGVMNQNMQQKLSVLKDENIELSQKVAKLQKENKFLKERQIQLSQKQKDMKNKLSEFGQKYQQIQKHNNDLLKMVQELQRQKNEMMSTIKQPVGGSAFDWKQVERSIEPVELKGSGYYSPWTFMQKDDMLLEKSCDIRSSIISNLNANRLSHQSRESTDKKTDQLKKKLSETQLLLENKQKINEELIIGFTKKIDKLNTEIEEQAKEQSKVMEKYIQENSRLRKEKERLQEEVNGLKSQLSRIKEKSPKKQSPIKQSPKKQLHDENQILEEEEFDVQQVQEGGFDMLEQRIGDDQGNGFMLGINEIDYSPQKTPRKQNSKDKEKEKQKQKGNYQSMLLEGDIMQFEDLEQRQEKIQLLQKQVQDLEETVQKLQKFLEETLNKVKQKEDEKTSLVEELQRKNFEVEELRDLIELKDTGKSNTLNLSKSINNILERPSLQKSDRPKMSSIFSLKLSQTNHGQRQRRASFDDQINFDFSQSNNRSNLQQSHLSGIFSENMSMIFEKQENFLDQINKAKKKRKQEGKLVKKTFEYIKKLRGSLNDKSRKIKILEMRLQELKDNCWLWRKNVDNMPGHAPFGEHSMQVQVTENHLKTEKELQHNYLDQNQSLSDQANDRMVDSRVFQCNSEDLNKKKPHRHNHYKKMEFDTKLIVEENRILTKQIEMLQQELLKIEEQENGLMAVKEIYKEEIRSLTRQNQQLKTLSQLQIQKMQDILQCSQAVHNYDAIKQLFKKIIDNIGVILYPNTSPEAKKKSANQLKQEKKKETEECIKVICSILNYEESIRNELCLRLTGQCQR